LCNGQQARARAIAFGLGVEGDEALGHEHAQNVQTRARDQRERPCDRVNAERLLAPAQQSEDRHRARHRGDGAQAPPHRFASRRFVPDRGHVSSRVALPRVLSLYNGSVILTTRIAGWSDGQARPLLARNAAMSRLTDYTSYADAHRHYSAAALWELFDGDRTSLNIAHECADRHSATDRVAVRVAHADGRDEAITFRELSEWSARFAHWLAARGVAPGDRVAIMLEPSLAFYAALFGAIKRGAIAVPLF